MDDHEQTEPAIGRGALVGAIVGFVTVAALFGAICIAAGAGPAGAGGIAVFAGIWGGPGFGAMLGATISATPPEER